jgi:hypothetical protein
VAQFICFLITVTNQKFIQEETERRLNSSYDCYHSIQNILSSCLSKNIKIRIFMSIILLVVLYGCKTWSLTLREAEDICEQDIENTWTQERLSNRILETAA